jgi:hypothetical protein
MKAVFNIRLFYCTVSLLAACLVHGATATATADEPVAGHSHPPLIVRSRPVIERLPVQVIQPIDLQVSRSGNIFVADSGANCIFRLDQFSAVSLHAQNLPGIRRICLDANESLYVLTSGTGESAILQITPEGRLISLHTLPVPAHSFARVGTSEWLATDGRHLWQINADSERTLLFKSPTAVLDLCTDPGGGNSALLSDGRVLQIGLDGDSRIAGFAPPDSQRLICQTDGRLMVLAEASAPARPGSSQLPIGIYPLVTNNADSPAAAIAHLPDGTLAAGFDALGNLCLANPQLRAVTKVTSRFRIPCPHCQESVLMIFDASVVPQNVGSF